MHLVKSGINDEVIDSEFWRAFVKSIYSMKAKQTKTCVRILITFTFLQDLNAAFNKNYFP